LEIFDDIEMEGPVRGNSMESIGTHSILIYSLALDRNVCWFGRM